MATGGTVHVARGFWAVILTCPAQARCWALVWPHSKHVVMDEVCALNRWYSTSPACNSLDHRAGVCYLPCSLCMTNFIMPLVCAYSWFPPLYFKRALHLINQGSHYSGAKIDVLHSIINYCAGLETQWLNVAGS